MFRRRSTTLWQEVGSCFSRLLNVVVFHGTADLSTSARAHAENWRRLERFIDRLFREPGHCRKWWDQERRRAQDIVDRGEA